MKKKIMINLYRGAVIATAATMLGDPPDHWAAINRVVWITVACVLCALPKELEGAE